jgi:hypothetical protein
VSPATLLMTAWLAHLSSSAAGSTGEWRTSAHEVFNDWWLRHGLRLVQPCRESAEKQGIFGDVVVLFEVRRARPQVRTWASRQVGKALERCVSRALQPAAGDLFVRVGSVESMSKVVTLGTLRPLLPPADQLVPLWIEFAEATARTRPRAQARLAKALPADARPAARGCLEISPTPGISQAVGLWLTAHAARVHPSWMDEPRLSTFGQDVTGAWLVEPHRSRLILQTLFGRQGVSEKTFALGTPRPYGRLVKVVHRLCLVDLADPASPVAREMATLANCVVASPATALMGPRASCQNRPR